jgi:Spy/CpxP family protein refolding chaperone
MTMKRIIHILLITALFLKVLPAMAQDITSPVEKEMAYRKVIFERSAKIVKGLNLTDSTRALLVTDIIARQYRDLNDIYLLRDNNKATIKAETGDNKEAAAAKLKKLDEEITAKIDKLHPKYLKSLAKAGLTPTQIDQVKDGMTYNVLNVTMTAYNSMMPNLTEPQKAQILAWLTEAREHAMDAESSEKKHGWFGKYKGRINNYLSAQGIDMKKEEAAWMARLKEEKSSKQ